MSDMWQLRVHTTSRLPPCRYLYSGASYSHQQYGAGGLGAYRNYNNFRRDRAINNNRSYHYHYMPLYYGGFFYGGGHYHHYHSDSHPHDDHFGAESPIVVEGGVEDDAVQEGEDEGTGVEAAVEEGVDMYGGAGPTDLPDGGWGPGGSERVRAGRRAAAWRWVEGRSCGGEPAEAAREARHAEGEANRRVVSGPEEWVERCWLKKVEAAEERVMRWPVCTASDLHSEWHPSPALSTSPLHLHHFSISTSSVDCHHHQPQPHHTT